MRQRISKKYLEQIIPLLVRKNLLNSTKGHLGGYRLSKSPAEISVKEILESAEGSLAPISSLDNAKFNHDITDGGEQLTFFVYKGLERVVTEYLAGISLQDIMVENSKWSNYVI